MATALRFVCVLASIMVFGIQLFYVNLEIWPSLTIVIVNLLMILWVLSTTKKADHVHIVSFLLAADAAIGTVVHQYWQLHGSSYISSNIIYRIAMVITFIIFVYLYLIVLRFTATFRNTRRNVERNKIKIKEDLFEKLKSRFKKTREEELEEVPKITFTLGEIIEMEE